MLGIKSMKIHKILFILIFAVSSIACSTEPDYEKYDKQLIDSFLDKAALRELRDALTRDLKTYPGDERLLHTRLMVNGGLGDHESRAADIYRLAELFPSSILYQFESCGTQERMNGYSEHAVQCYSGVLALYENTIHKDKLRLNSLYVVTALLAKSPDAKKLQESFIREAGDSPSLCTEVELLRHFDRKYFVAGEESPGANYERCLRMMLDYKE